MDAVGKAKGKRVLNADGTWTPVTALPKAQQEEIKAANRQAAQERRDKALSQTSEYKAKQAADSSAELRAENKSLRDLIERQNALLEKVVGQTSKGVIADVVKEDEAVIEADKLTPKQRLQEQAELLGINFTQKTTMAELEQMIEEYDVDGEESEEDESEPEL